MATPENPRQADAYAVDQNYTNKIFSDDPQEEKDLTEYYLWLRNQIRLGNITEEQRSDYEALQMKQNYYAIVNKPYDTLTDQQRNLWKQLGQMPSQYGRIQSPPGKVEILQDRSELPRFSSSSSGSTGQIEEVKLNVNDPNAPTLFRARDYQKNTVKYYYVLKDVKKYKETVAGDNLLSRYRKLADVIQSDPQGPGGSNPLSTLPVSTTPKTTPAKISKLWYSEDYKKTYAEEIKRISLQILNMPELILSNFDYETLDYVPDTVGIIMRVAGEVTSYTYGTDKEIIRSNTNPLVSNLIYKIQDESIAPMMKSLSPLRSGYEKYLQNFGHYIKRSSNKSITQYFPGYTQSGNPYYDIEITFDDAAEVTGYTIYLVEEDGII